MRKIILLIGILVGVPFCMKAQNEMYFLPESQKEIKEKKEVKRETSQRNTVSTTPKDKVRKIYIPSGSTVVLHETEYNNDKIDQYNRRNQVLIAGDEEYEYVPPTRGGEWINHGFEGSMDDYGDAERAITSRDRRYSISISSPNYWDVVYGLNSWDWNIYVDDFDAYIFPKYTNRYWSSWKFGFSPRLSIWGGISPHHYGGWYDPWYSGGWGYYSSWGYPSWGWGHSWGGWYDPYYPSWGWGGGYYPYYGRRSKGYYTNRRYDGYSSYGRGSSASSSTRYRANSSSTRYNPTDRSVRRGYSSTRNRSTGTFINSGSNTSSSVRPVRTNRTNAVRYDNVQYNRGGNSNVRNSTRATDNRSTIRYTRPSSTRSNSTRNRTVYSNRNNSRDFNVNRSSSSSFNSSNSSTRSSYSGGSSTRSSYSSGSTSSRSSNSSGSSTRSSGGSSSRTNATRR